MLRRGKGCSPTHGFPRHVRFLCDIVDLCEYMIPGTIAQLRKRVDLFCTRGLHVCSVPVEAWSPHHRLHMQVTVLIATFHGGGALADDPSIVQFVQDVEYSRDLRRSEVFALPGDREGKNGRRLPVPASEFVQRRLPGRIR